MKRIDPDHIKALLGLANLGPYYGLLSMKLCELGIGYSRVEVALENKHRNPFGVIHGGVYSSVIDTAAYWAVYCELDENIGFTTIDINVNILSMVKEEKIIAEGKSLKVGRSICLSEATAKDTHGKLLAYGTSKMLIVQGLQSIDHAVNAMGYQALPPKFLM
jgi:uncharacterized protein (TIGR00369 family)